ncbi:hypothetical protein NE237_022610 [Protea cynaroides]|uniref:Uncharacterized protein n=1 Tax=Protea cynaroides TaxID=273540 RepID=A0A9Q0K4D5_9MAGN|nr:hypothetical protein NE237_022610 [Protea cynaroides]
MISDIVEQWRPFMASSSGDHSWLRSNLPVERTGLHRETSLNPTLLLFFISSIDRNYGVWPISFGDHRAVIEGSRTSRGTLLSGLQNQIRLGPLHGQMMS